MVLPDEVIINTLLDYLIGTLWIAKEDLLKDRISFWDQNSTRQGHPVLSIVFRKIIGKEKIPMLVGSSQKSGASIPVNEVFGDDKTTYFRTLGRFNPSDFIGKNRRIEKNRNKSRLNELEMKLLNEWMEERGLIK
jgi:hypothetical protein